MLATQGTRLRPLLQNSRTKIVPLMLLSCLVPILAGCTHRGTGTAAACDAYGSPLTYSGSRDTKETARGIEIKNKTFSKLGCF